jgi:hypothetical protein
MEMPRNVLYARYFTEQVCEGIRDDAKLEESWKSYLTYHKSQGMYDRKKLMYMFEEFKYIYGELTSKTPKALADIRRIINTNDIEG